MKRKTTSILFLGLSILTSGQSVQADKSVGSKSHLSSTYLKCVSFHVTKALRELGSQPKDRHNQATEFPVQLVNTNKSATSQENFHILLTR